MKIRLKHFRGIWKYILLAIPVAFCALPLIYMVNTAFKPLNEMLRFPPTFFVKNPTLEDYAAANIESRRLACEYLKITE